MKLLIYSLSSNNSLSGKDQNRDYALHYSTDLSHTLEPEAGFRNAIPCDCLNLVLPVLSAVLRTQKRLVLSNETS